MLKKMLFVLFRFEKPTPYSSAAVFSSCASVCLQQLALVTVTGERKTRGMQSVEFTQGGVECEQGQQVAAGLPCLR